MNNLKDSVVKSLDGSGTDIFPYLPYLLQDLRAFGTDPIAVSEMLHNFVDDVNTLKILDLGCGKGAVSVRLAKDYNCLVFGIDALPEFIESAKEYAIEKGVYHKCLFTQGDIRKQYMHYNNYDLVILGAIGPVLGNTQETLQKVYGCLKEDGYVVLDDCCIPENSKYVHENCTSQSQFFKQIKKAGFSVIDEKIMSFDYMNDQNKVIFDAIKNRAGELIKKHPPKSNIFKAYIEEQEIENEALENQLICGIWLLKKV